MNHRSDFLRSINGTWQEINSPTLSFKVDGIDMLFQNEKGDFEMGAFNLLKVAAPNNYWIFSLPLLGIVFGAVESITNDEIVIVDINDISELNVNSDGK